MAFQSIFILFNQILILLVIPREQSNQKGRIRLHILLAKSPSRVFGSHHPLISHRIYYIHLINHSIHDTDVIKVLFPSSSYMKRINQMKIFLDYRKVYILKVPIF